MHQLARPSFSVAVLTALLTAFGGAQAAAAEAAKAQTAAVEKQAAAAAAKGNGQSIVALVNDEPVTAYEIEQRARFLALSANIGDKVKDNFKRLAQQESTNQQLRSIMQEVIERNKGKSNDQLRAIVEEKKTQCSM